MSAAKMPKEVRQALENCGKPWIIKKGKRHNKIVVDGVMLGILPFDGGSEKGSAHKKTVAQIRRAM